MAEFFRIKIRRNGEKKNRRSKVQEEGNRNYQSCSWYKGSECYHSHICWRGSGTPAAFYEIKVEGFLSWDSVLQEELLRTKQQVLGLALQVNAEKYPMGNEPFLSCWDKQRLRCCALATGFEKCWDELGVAVKTGDCSWADMRDLQWGRLSFMLCFRYLVSSFVLVTKCT